MAGGQKIRWTALALSLVGLGVSLYLTYIKLFHVLALCTGVGDCETVNTSKYSQVAGIPIAIFGALAYLALIFLFSFETRGSFLSANAPLIEFGLSFVGFLYSLYLTYLELFVIHAICPYCVTSALAMTAVFVISAVRVRKFI